MSDYTELLYLRPDVQAEPLWDSWYAWTHLISPATAARNLTHRHLKIMDSYIAGPQFHANALKNPQMIGGPFVDLGGQRVDEIKSLRDRTRSTQAPLIALSNALAELDGLLQGHSGGGSLLPLYAQVPEVLKGYVELCYDLNHRPSYRPIEGLLYRSKYFDRSAQSLMLSLTGGDARPFVTSTPRLAQPGAYHWRMPFDSPEIDRLFALETTPRPWPEIRALLDSGADDEPLLRSFFTTRPPRRAAPAEPLAEDAVQWRYFGHACVLIESGGVSVMLDPSVSYDYPTDLPRYSFGDLPERIDYVVLTHNHQDHVMLETLLRLRGRIGTIVVPANSGGGLQDPSLALQLRAIGFRNVVPVQEMESLDIGPGSITGLPFLGEHGDLNIQAKLGQLVRMGRHTMLFATDACGVEPRLYAHLREALGPVDTLFVGMECDGAPFSWVYGPLMSRPPERAVDQGRRLNGSDADQANAIVEQLGCKSVYVYAMGQEPWLSHVMGLKYTPDARPIIESDRLMQLCARRGIAAERLYGHKQVRLES